MCVPLYNLFFSHTDLVPIVQPGSKDLVTTPIIGLRSLNNTIQPVVYQHSAALCLEKQNNQLWDERWDERVGSRESLRGSTEAPMRVRKVVRRETPRSGESRKEKGERSWLSYGSVPHSACLLTLDTAWANQQVWHVTAMIGTDQSLSHWEVCKQAAGLLLGTLLHLFKTDERERRTMLEASNTLSTWFSNTRQRTH